MNKFIVLIALLVVAILGMYPHLIGLHEDKIEANFAGRNFSITLPSGTCFPENEAFSREATSRFQQSTTANSSKISAITTFVTCESRWPGTEAQDIYPWGYVVGFDIDYSKVPQMRQSELSAVIQARISDPEITANVEGLGDANEQLNEIATSTLLTMGIGTENAAGVLGDYSSRPTPPSLSIQNSEIALYAAEGRKRINDQLRQVRASIGVFIVKERVFGLLLFAYENSTTPEDDALTIKNFSRTMKTENRLAK